MKIHFLFLLFFFTQIHFSQNIEKLKRSDTIYVHFDNNTPGHIHHKDISKNKKLPYDIYYMQIDSLSSLEFTHHYVTTKERRYETKSFLKKNNDLTVNSQFLKDLGFINATKLFYSETGKKKKVYIIEKNSIKCFKVLLKEVSNPSFYPIYDE